MAAQLKIDFISDVSCPWCAIGLASLEHALDRLGDEVSAQIHFQPFELNPQMPAVGRNTVDYLAEKYGRTPEQLKQNSDAIRARGAEVGFVFGGRERVYNTFDAHRLLHWAGLEGRQIQLKHALLEAYFTDGKDVSAHDVLVQVASQAGLDAQQAQEVLASGAYADEVREQEQQQHKQGINSVPAIIINDRHLIQGGQTVEVFEQALREISGI
ncbi:DsbA family oxidoreductase [Allopusillimonas ginsengisoli]|uniref:DsbA family oxidoreductase n=1 Tax=Allopusillimonas ginsengisoli TaxID=453575 RepID=UPI0039C12560